MQVVPFVPDQSDRWERLVDTYLRPAGVSDGMELRISGAGHGGRRVRADRSEAVHGVQVWQPSREDRHRAPRPWADGQAARRAPST